MAHVAIVLNTAWNLKNFRANLIRAMVTEGHTVSGLAPFDEYADGLAELDCQFVDVPMDNKGTSVIGDLALFIRLYRILRRLRPDVLLCYTVKPNVYASIAAHLLGIPVINNVAGLGTVFIRRGVVTRLVMLLYRIAFSRSRRVFFQNQDDREFFIDSGLVREAQTDRLPGSGVDLSRFASLPLPAPKPFRFLLIARLLYDKGIGEYVEAARRLKASHPDVECCLLGFLDVENVTAVPRDDVQRWEKEGLVTYLGASDAVSDEIARCHCVVLPSYREGLSRTLLEGAASARPLIATDVPGCRELVSPGVNGYLADSADAGSLYAAMARLVDDGVDTWARYGKASRRLVEAQYDEQVVIRRYQEELQRLLRAR